MAPEKVTKMVLDVDLNCSDCYKKVKKLLNKIPEVRDQEYDVEKNKVKISVVSTCCSPDKIRDKLCHKGGSSIQKILILLPDNKPAKPKPPPAAAADLKPKLKEPEKPPKEAPKKPAADQVAKMIVEPSLVHGYPYMYPAAATYPMVYDQGHHYSHPFPAVYGYERGYNHNGYNANASHHYSTTSDYYFSEENSQGCSVM